MSRRPATLLAASAALLCILPTCLSAPAPSLHAPRTPSSGIDEESFNVREEQGSPEELFHPPVASGCGGSEEHTEVAIIALNLEGQQHQQSPFVVGEKSDESNDNVIEALHTCHPTHWRWSYLWKSSCLRAAAQIQSDSTGGFALSSTPFHTDDIPENEPRRLYSTSDDNCEIVVSYRPGRKQQRLQHKYSWELIKEAALAQIDGCAAPKRWIGAADLVGGGRAILSIGDEQGEVWVDVGRRGNEGTSQSEREARDYL